MPLPVAFRHEKRHLYKGSRYPAQIISHVVWLYFRFSLNFRDVDEFAADSSPKSTVVAKILGLRIA